ncbi:putative serine protease PepD [Phycicoccus badiiscoriae]|uniref:Putative serine protease PepD n=1 Tax=Pedococcus badiiscoriae TaxID=642776 RepID=A0A852WDG1_9MICO|nr:trypsin-like peptidase domain-containing protein [Pedococcus badiiscoriae]NYG07223.1 putative serine protease PepD [Pedococcus badiiscoriae]
MTQIHPDTRPETPGDGAVPPQGEPTAPVWFGQTQEITPPAGRTYEPARDDAAFGRPGVAGDPTRPGVAGDPTLPAADAHPAYPPLSQPPAGPPPSFPTRDGAEPAQPGKRRRLTELTAVAALAALLASGGTYAAVQVADGSQPTSVASTSTLGRGANAGPVVQADATNPNWTATAAAVAPSVVAITVKSAQGEAQGSGVIIDAKGHILTNNHVVSGAGPGTSITATLNDGRTYKATIAGTDPSTDLAVITLSAAPADLKPIAIGNSADLKVGDPVMAIGNPLGLAGTVTTGIVSALNRPVTTSAAESQQQQDPFGQQPQTGSDGNTVVTNAIQTSAAINPGNSGGALVNAAGQLIGINSAIASLGSSGGGQSGSIGIGFAIPANEAKSIASQLISSGKAKHAFLGVSLGDATASDGSSQRAGAQITQISANTPAADAGLRKGDVVIAVDSTRVDSALSLVANIRERAVGDKVTLTVLRNGKQLNLTATLVARASS